MEGQGVAATAKAAAGEQWRGAAPILAGGCRGEQFRSGRRQFVQFNPDSGGRHTGAGIEYVRRQLAHGNVPKDPNDRIANQRERATSQGSATPARNECMRTNSGLYTKVSTLIVGPQVPGATARA